MPTPPGGRVDSDVVERGLRRRYNRAQKSTRPPKLRASMDRRKFLATSGIFGAGLFGASNAASSLLHAEPSPDFASNLNLEANPVAFSLPPLPYPNDALDPHLATRATYFHH